MMGAVACDPGAEATFVNETDQTIEIFLSDAPDAGATTVSANSTWTGAVIEHVWRDMVIVQDVEGNVLYRQELTWEEFKERDYRFVVTEDMIGEPPSSDP